MPTLKLRCFGAACFEIIDWTGDQGQLPLMRRPSQWLSLGRSIQARQLSFRLFGETVIFLGHLDQPVSGDRVSGTLGLGAGLRRALEPMAWTYDIPRQDLNKCEKLSRPPTLRRLHRNVDRFDRSSRQTCPTPCGSPATGGQTAATRGFAIGCS